MRPLGLQVFSDRHPSFARSIYADVGLVTDDIGEWVLVWLHAVSRAPAIIVKLSPRAFTSPGFAVPVAMGRDESGLGARLGLLLRLAPHAAEERPYLPPALLKKAATAFGPIAAHDARVSLKTIGVGTICVMIQHD